MSEDTRRVNKAGEEWFGFLCSNPNCGLPLLLGEIRSDMLDPQGGVEIGTHSRYHKLTCPHCGNESVYQPEQLRRFRTVEKDKLS